MLDIDDFFLFLQDIKKFKSMVTQKHTFMLLLLKLTIFIYIYNEQPTRLFDSTLQKRPTLICIIGSLYH